MSIYDVICWIALCFCCAAIAYILIKIVVKVKTKGYIIYDEESNVINVELGDLYPLKEKDGDFIVLKIVVNHHKYK